MTVWQEISGHDALRPKPSLDVMAELHIDSTQLGFSDDVELRLLESGRRAEGLTLLLGPSGAGKSSHLARLAQRLHREPRSDRSDVHALPIFVPVAAVRERAFDLAAFGRGTIQETLALLQERLNEEDRRRLQQITADSVSTAHTPAIYNAALAAGVPGLEAKLGAELGHDVVTVLTEPMLADGGLPELARTVAAHGLQLVLMIEDTDAWAEMPDGGERALGFFTEILRPLCADTGLVVIAAVQDHWRTDHDTRDALEALQERAAGLVELTPRPEAAALDIFSRILLRRIGFALAGAAPPIDTLIAPEALAMLAHPIAEASNIRAALARLRDVLDFHRDALPERLEEEHVVDVL